MTLTGRQMAYDWPGRARRRAGGVRLVDTVAERQMGEFLKQMPKATGGRPKKTGADEEPVSDPTLSDLGITKKQSATAQKLATKKPALGEESGLP